MRWIYQYIIVVSILFPEDISKNNEIKLNRETVSLVIVPIDIDLFCLHLHLQQSTDYA